MFETREAFEAYLLDESRHPPRKILPWKTWAAAGLLLTGMVAAQTIPIQGNQDIRLRSARWAFSAFGVDPDTIPLMNSEKPIFPSIDTTEIYNPDWAD